MSENEKKMPKRRFKEFENAGAWEQRKLGKMADFSKGVGYSKNDLTDKGTPIILYGMLYTKYQTVIDHVNIFTIPKTGSVYSSGREVIVPASGETSVDIARASSVAISGVLLGGDLNIIYPPNHIDTVFLALSISNGNQQKELSKRAQGKSVVHLRNDDLREVELSYPEIKEQLEISNFFSNLDNLITLHKCKLEKMKSLKKAYLTEMFPAEGERKPKRRFAGFTDDWKPCKLGAITDLITGYPFESNKFTKEGILLIRGMNIKRGYLDTSEDICEYWPSHKGLESYLLVENDILIQMDGALIGKSYAKITDKNLPALLVQRVTRVRSRKVDSDYIYQCIQRDFLKQILETKTETAVPHLSLNDIKDFKILITSPDEQAQIGSFFKKFDNLITLKEQKIVKLQNIKKAYLTEMFV